MKSLVVAASRCSVLAVLVSCGGSVANPRPFQMPRVGAPARLEPLALARHALQLPRIVNAVVQVRFLAAPTATASSLAIAPFSIAF